MNKTENQLASMSEECHEAGQAACKAMRFGIDHTWPEKNETNRRILEREIADILGVAEELGLVIRPEDIAAKRAKLQKYQVLSVELGTLEVCDPRLEQLELQYREAAKMALVLLEYIHSLKHHDGGIQNCTQEPCPATVEFLGKHEKRKCLREGLIPRHGTFTCELEEGHDGSHRQTVNGHPFGW